MSYTQYDEKLGRYVVRCTNSDGPTFYFQTQVKEDVQNQIVRQEASLVYGEVIDRLAELERQAAREREATAKKDIIENGVNLGAGDFVDIESLKIAAAALDRLIPEKPKLRAMDGFDIEVAAILCCPTCGGSVTNYWVRGAKPKHCQFCGQAIDWEEEKNATV